LIISIDAEKAFNKIQHHFMVKALRKLGIEGMTPETLKLVQDGARHSGSNRYRQRGPQ
jgi:hypothetical protein